MWQGQEETSGEGGCQDSDLSVPRAGGAVASWHLLLRGGDVGENVGGGGQQQAFSSGLREPPAYRCVGTAASHTSAAGKGPVPSSLTVLDLGTPGAGMGDARLWHFVSMKAPSEHAAHLAG